MRNSRQWVTGQCSTLGPRNVQAFYPPELLLIQVGARLTDQIAKFFNVSVN